MRLPWTLSLVVVSGCATPRFPLERVILYQNGIGYFERVGRIDGQRVVLPFSRHEVDDAMKTLTVLDRAGGVVTTLEVPAVIDEARPVPLTVGLGQSGTHDLRVSYAVPTPVWKATYRVVLDDKDEASALLQGWAKVDNATQEDWRDVRLTLATGAPLSFAMDLHSPTYVDRPDLSGRLVSPVATGRIANEQVGAALSDVDSDGDRIPDRLDKCPNDPETYNGIDDDDGCPDRGRIVVTGSSIEILDSIYFGSGSAAVRPESRPILDAIAATLAGNPSIKVIEVEGHAEVAEPDAQRLSERRAAAVQAALVGKGVSSLRLQVRGYAATRPIDPAKTEAARAKNRRVGFRIVRRDDETREEDGKRGGTFRAPALDASTVATSARPTTHAVEVAGAARYELGGRVTVNHGRSTMVAILNQRVTGEDAYLFRPDPNAPGSERHPFRVVRLVNTSGFSLQPGPAAIFARGTFVGDSMLDALERNETAWIPYALDSGTTVTVTGASSERPVRIVSVHKGVLTIENAGVRTTTYTIAAGQQPAHRLYVRHAKAAGYTLATAPPGMLDRGDVLLIPVPLTPAQTVSLVIEEREPRRRRFEIGDWPGDELRLYVEGTLQLPAAMATRLAEIVKLRRELATTEEELAAARTRFDELLARNEELRANLRALEKVKTADDLKKKLLAKLAAATVDNDKLTKEITVKSEAMATARARLRDAVSELELEETR